MTIQTNISLTAPQKEYFQRFVNLSVNEEALPQGDGVIRISPFDDYFLFTLYDEIDSEDTPIDLSNVGDIFINFISELSADLESTEIDAINQRARAASELQRKNAVLKQQSIALRKTDSIYNNQKDFYVNAANNLQQYSI